MSETDPNLKQEPVVLVPMSAEDDARRRARIKWSVAIAGILAIAVAGVTYKRYTDPLNAKESFDAGVRLYKIARYNQAIVSFDRAIAYQPGLAEAYLMRAKSFVGDAKPETSLTDFTKYIQLQPSDPSGYVGRGLAYLELGKMTEATNDAGKALALNPNLAAAYNLRGTIVRKAGDAQKALGDFNRAVELDASADNYYQRGATYQLMGEHKLAIADFDKVIELIPDISSAYFARAASKRAIGDTAGAQEDHRRGRILDGH